MTQQFHPQCRKVGLPEDARHAKPIHKPLILKDFLEIADSIKP